MKISEIQNPHYQWPHSDLPHDLKDISGLLAFEPLWSQRNRETIDEKQKPITAGAILGILCMLLLAPFLILASIVTQLFRGSEGAGGKRAAQCNEPLTKTLCDAESPWRSAIEEWFGGCEGSDWFPDAIFQGYIPEDFLKQTIFITFPNSDDTAFFVIGITPDGRAALFDWKPHTTDNLLRFRQDIAWVENDEDILNLLETLWELKTSNFRAHPDANAESPPMTDFQFRKFSIRKAQKDYE